METNNTFYDERPPEESGSRIFNIILYTGMSLSSLLIATGGQPHFTANIYDALGGYTTPTERGSAKGGDQSQRTRYSETYIGESYSGEPSERLSYFDDYPE